jgi:hypothetical protein
MKFFNKGIQWAGWNAMPEHRDTWACDCSILIKKSQRKKKTS